MAFLLKTVFLLVLFVVSSAFMQKNYNHRGCQLNKTSKMQLSMNLNMLNTFESILQSPSLLLADTSISEEDVINVVGQSADLPDPIFFVITAAVIFLSVGVLQFSLGDITTEEGQARVRDFLQTKKNTERKRGYFD